MDLEFFFGPDKKRCRLLDNGMIDADGSVYFHGIISRGLLNAVIANKLRIDLWHQHAHDPLFPETISADPDLEKLKGHFRKSKALTLAQSSVCAKKYVEHFLAERNLEDAHIELWNLKEGHTSSVWKVTIRQLQEEETFILNVARDYEAGLELKDSSEKLKTIADHFPGIHLASVYDIYTLQDKAFPSDVVITRNEWIDNSYEIHSRLNKQTGAEELMMIERFMTDDNNPAQITSVFGRLFNHAETGQVRGQVDEFLSKASCCLASKPELNINEGDVVWDGKMAVIVAIT